MKSSYRNRPRARRRVLRSPHRTARVPQRRRGVILLVVLGMLALFTVIVLTFVIVARQNMVSANAALRSKHYDDAYEEHLNQAALQIIRGTTNGFSVLGPHSLLEDLYADPRGEITLPNGDIWSTGVFGTIASVSTPVVNGPLYDVTITTSSTLSTINDYFNGRVLSVLDGDDRSSYRIVDYDGSSNTFRLLSNSEGAPANGAEILINGRAFSGPGFGYQLSNFSNTAGSNDLLDFRGSGDELALLPNPRDVDYQDYLNNLLDDTGLTPNAPPGVFANEDHDAPTIQDMLLGLRVSSSTAGNSVPIPSLHRPALLNYWANRRASFYNNTTADADFRARVSLRPDHITHHPSFPSIDLVNGPWDVDNDGDGIPDSIWVDIGLPVETAPDGRQFKPLVAILCLDMDGKLNLNVHGQLNDWNNEQNNGNPKYTNPQTHLVQQSRPPNPPGPFELAGLNPTSMPTPNAPFSSVNLLSGMGVGPQEVNIASARPDLNLTILLPDNEFRNLLRGLRVGTNVVEGKYGEGYLLPAGASSSTSAVLLAGETGVDDNLPAGAIAQVAGSPFDLDGNGVLALDPRGQPRFYFMGSANGANGINNLLENQDDAGEFDPTARRHYTSGSGIAKTDYPYGPEDLEWLLRQSDVDGGTLPSRLPDLCSSLIDSGSFRYNSSRATTESWDIPVPSFVPTPEIAQGLARLNLPAANLGIVDLIRGKLAFVNSSATQAQIDAHINTLIGQDVVAPELLAGYRFNVNRPFGSGDDGVAERLAYARHLYFLMQLLTDYNYGIDVSGASETNTPAARRELTAHRLAQWCINAVDFRDADAKMTPFEYIIDPFTGVTVGWNLDNNPFSTVPATIMGNPPIPRNEDELTAADVAMGYNYANNYNVGRRMVWGNEAPLLLLTESLAFHDRRVKDTDKGGLRTDPDPLTRDMTMDQVRVPQGSAFFELYCVANNKVNNPTIDASLFNTTTGNLELGKMPFPDSPVWRLAITGSGLTANPMGHDNEEIADRLTEKPYTTSLEPLDGATPAGPFSLINELTEETPQIERIVWFSRTPPTTDTNRVYYRRIEGMPANPPEVELPPGHYAVVGPHRKTESPDREDDNVTKIGARGMAPAPQEIQLGFVDTTTPTFSTPAFHVTTNNGAGTYATAIRPETQAVLGIPVAGDAANMFPIPVGLSVSEPTLDNYYPTTDDLGAALTVTTDPIDNMQTMDAYTERKEPLDTAASLGVPDLKTGTNRNYKTVYLQRLADPTRPHNLRTNPYRTVDWMPIDLTVFNGESNPDFADANPATFESSDPLDPDRGNWTAGHAREIRLGTRQRGVPRTPPAAPTMDIWSAVSDYTTIPNTVIPKGALTMPADTFGRMVNLDHTLGYINQPFHVTANTPAWWGAGNPYNDSTTAYVEYKGDPRLPIPWLTWSNRPYVSQFELMQVPYSTSARLTWDYGHVYTSGTPDFYAERSTTARTDGRPAATSTPYGHLLNFFLSSNAASDPSTTAGARSNYYRIFDYLHVPSPYSGTAVELPTAGMPAPFNASPYNRITTFREPGRINVNTISDAEQRTWLGATNSFNSVQGATYGNGHAPWDQMRYSRQDFNTGFIETPGTLPPNTFPDVFGNPFRSPGTANYAPIASMRTGIGNFVDGSWLRQLQTGGNTPLFQFLSRPGIDAVPTGSYPYRDAFNDSDRNAYFRYQMYSKMGNVLTTRSNVYAIWITVGFFAVTPWDSDNDGDVDFDTGHTDGYALQAELGSDTGEIRRHRAFYIYDRSIPVAFERGKNHNVHRGMLVKRIIE